MEKTILKKIPEIGKKYHFFDDGKIRESRHYILEVVEIIDIEQSKNIIFDLIDYDDWNQEKCKFEIETPYQNSLYKIWLQEKDVCDWLYAPETDLFIKCRIPDYDEDFIYFCRTLDGGWFSIETTHGWQCGRLDIDGAYFETLKCATDFYNKFKDI